MAAASVSRAPTTMDRGRPLVAAGVDPRRWIRPTATQRRVLDTPPLLKAEYGGKIQSSPET